MTTYEWITTSLVPVTGIVSWLAGARMRKNSTINAKQTTIDMLVEQNADLYKKIIDLRQENTDLRVSINAGNIEIERLKTEIERLKK